MARVISGSKDLKKKQASGKMAQDARVTKGSADPRQLRCKRCGNLANNIPDGKGGLVLKCTFCNTTYKTVTI